MTECFLYNIKDPEYNQVYFNYLTEDEKNCIGMNFTNIEDWKLYWSKNNCPQIFYDKIYTDSINGRFFNPSGFDQVSSDFTYIFDTYFQQNSKTTKGNHKFSVPGDPLYNSFQETLIETCSNNPVYNLVGACSSLANYRCQNCTSTQVASNNELLKLCGCQVQSLDFNSDLYKNVSTACDPLCLHEIIVKNINLETGIPYECNATTCVINNISIVSTESLYSNTSFIQICPGCSGTNACVCILDVSVSEDAGIQNDIEFKQYCGSNSVCIVIENDVEKVVDCQTNINTLKAEEYYYPIPITIWIIILIIIILFIIVFLAVKNDFFNFNSYS